MSPLQESLLILSGLDKLIAKASRSLFQAINLDNEDLKFTVCNQVQLLLCNFHKEWRRLEGLGSDPEIRKSLRVASPAVKRIGSWPGLEKVRNMLLAHPQRDSDGKITPPWEVLARYNAPTTYWETVLLSDCARLAISVVLQCHFREYKQAAEMADEQHQEIEDKGVRTPFEAKVEFDKINEIVVSKMHEVGVSFIDNSKNFSTL
jgi:hypothetical protein